MNCCDNNPISTSKMKKLSFQEIILKLQNYWQEYGCAILQPYDVEVGAGTFHPATVLKPMTTNPWNVAYVQPSRRPTDSRYANHPNRMQHYYQFQVILKPSPDDVQDLYLDSLRILGIDTNKNEIRFVEDDWKSPTLGASGLGWEVWCNGMEISQFTYMQQIGGYECRPTPVELTYGLERLALYIQGINNVWDLDWNGQTGDRRLTYKDVFYDSEKQFSTFNLEYADTEILFRHFNDIRNQCEALIEKKLPLPAYDYCIKASHIFNLLDARGVISVTERESYITKVRQMTKACIEKWMEMGK